MDSKKHNLLRLNHEEIENLSRLITSNEIESVILKLPKNESLEPGSFTGKFYQIFQQELVPILLKLFQNIEEEGMLPILFYKARITFIPKPGRDTLNTKIWGQYPQ